MFNRVKLSQVHHDLSIPHEKQMDKPSRKLAFRWGCHLARKEFKDYFRVMREACKEFKREPSGAIGTLFDVAILGAFGSVDTTFCATVKFSKFFAGTILHPDLVIRNDDEEIIGDGERAHSRHSSHSSQEESAAEETEEDSSSHSAQSSSESSSSEAKEEDNDESLHVDDLFRKHGSKKKSKLKTRYEQDFTGSVSN